MHFILVIPKIDIGSKSKIVNLSITTSVVVLTNVESINTTSILSKTDIESVFSTSIFPLINVVLPLSISFNYIIDVQCLFLKKNMVYSLYFPPYNFKRHIKSLNKNCVTFSRETNQTSDESEI